MTALPTMKQPRVRAGCVSGVWGGKDDDDEGCDGSSENRGVLCVRLELISCVCVGGQCRCDGEPLRQAVKRLAQTQTQTETRRLGRAPDSGSLCVAEEGEMRALVASARLINIGWDAPSSSAGISLCSTALCSVAKQHLHMLDAGSPRRLGRVLAGAGAAESMCSACCLTVGSGMFRGVV